MLSFGTCCKDMQQALSFDEGSTFQVMDDGALFLNVGLIQTGLLRYQGRVLPVLWD